jgi:glucokinase
LAADIGGTHLRAAAVNRAGDVVARQEADSGQISGPEDAIERIAALLAAAASGAPGAPSAACLGTPGLIDGDRGVVILAPNVPGFRNLALAEPIGRRLGLPAFIENDASVAALGEARYGAGMGTRHLLHATLGTGIGGGIVIDGRLYRGARGLAGEIGHVVIDPSGPRCNCGSRGCLEALVSGVAFAERARRLVAQGRSPLLATGAASRSPDSRDLFAAAVAGCAASAAEIQNGGHLLGLVLGGLTNVLNPGLITLSGGLLAMGAMLLEPARAAMHSIAYGPASGTLLKETVLGDNAGLLGAAAVAFDRLG